MSDLISRDELLKRFSVNSNGDKIPEYDIDNFPVTIAVKDVKEMIRKQPKVSEQEIRNKAIEEFAEKFVYKAICSGCSGCTNCYEEQRQCECEDWKSYMEIAEQVKSEVQP